MTQPTTSQVRAAHAARSAAYEARHGFPEPTPAPEHQYLEEWSQWAYQRVVRRINHRRREGKISYYEAQCQIDELTPIAAMKEVTDMTTSDEQTAHQYHIARYPQEVTYIASAEVARIIRRALSTGAAIGIHLAGRDQDAEDILGPESERGYHPADATTIAEELIERVVDNALARAQATMTAPIPARDMNPHPIANHAGRKLPPPQPIQDYDYASIVDEQADKWPHDENFGHAFNAIEDNKADQLPGAPAARTQFAIERTASVEEHILSLVEGPVASIARAYYSAGIVDKAAEWTQHIAEERAAHKLGGATKDAP